MKSVVLSCGGAKGRHAKTRTRGPRVPWVANLRKRLKVTVEPIIENPRGIIWTILVDVLLMMLYIINIKALGLVVSDKKIFESFILKPIYWPRDLLMQPTGTVWTTLIGEHPGIIPVKFGQIPISGSREDVVLSFPYIIQCKLVTPGRGQFWPQGHNLNNFGKGPLDDAIF